MSADPEYRHDANNVIVISRAVVKRVHGPKPFRRVEPLGNGCVRISDVGYDTLEEAERAVVIERLRR